VTELARVTVNPTGVSVAYFPPDNRRMSTGTLESVLAKLLANGWKLISYALPERGWEVWVFQREQTDD